MSFDKYRETHHPIDFDKQQVVFDQLCQEEHQAYCQQKITQLQRDLQMAEFQLSKVNNRRQKALKRWHLSRYLPDYFPPDLRDDEYVKQWLDIVKRESALALSFKKKRHRGKTIQGITHRYLGLQQKIEGLKAELFFWEQQVLKTKS